MIGVGEELAGIVLYVGHSLPIPTYDVLRVSSEILIEGSYTHAADVFPN